MSIEVVDVPNDKMEISETKQEDAKADNVGETKK